MRIAFALFLVLPACSQDRGAIAVLKNLTSPQAVASDPQAWPFVAAGGEIGRLVARGRAQTVARTGAPRGLAFDAAGDLYVADGGRKAILKVKPWGEAATFIGPLTDPGHVIVATDGSVYFTDGGRVERATGNGAASVIASGVRAPGGLLFAAAAGRLLVSDGENKIWSLAADGTGRRLFATLAGEGKAAGMAMDDRGNLYVARDGGGRVSVLDPEGKLVSELPVPGPRATGIAFAGATLSNLYVAEAESGTLYRIAVANRSQRLPWERDAALAITEPLDGAILNRHDGAAAGAGLRIVVKGYSRLGGPVRVNGAAAELRDGRFEAAVVLQDRETVIRAEAGGSSQTIRVLWDRDSFPRYRVSTDDNILWLKDIAQHGYSSIFDNAYLGFWREMHRKYGAKVHFNIYYETPGFNLSEMPEKYRPEWRKNAGWIRLTFHARANDPDRPYIHASPEKIREDYRLVTHEIERFAGKELLAPITTVHWGVMPRAAARALREEGVRALVAYFDTSDDLPHVCNYLPWAQWRYMLGRDYWRDTAEDLIMIRHDIVINSFPLDKIVPRLEKIASDPHQSEVMELMIHEQYFYPDYVAYEPDYRQRVEAAIKWVSKHGYKPVLYDEGFLGAGKLRP